MIKITLAGAITAEIMVLLAAKLGHRHWGCNSYVGRPADRFTPIKDDNSSQIKKEKT